MDNSFVDNIVGMVVFMVEYIEIFICYFVKLLNGLVSVRNLGLVNCKVFKVLFLDSDVNLK